MKRFLVVVAVLVALHGTAWGADDPIQSAASGTSELAYRFPRGYTGGHYVEPASENVTVRVHMNGAVKYRYTAYASNAVFVPIAGDSLYIVRATATAVKTVFALPGGMVIPGGSTAGATTDTNTDSLDTHHGRLYYQTTQVVSDLDSLDAHHGKLYYQATQIDDHVDGLEGYVDSVEAQLNRLYFQFTDNLDSYGHTVSPDKGTITVTSGDTIAAAETFSAFIGDSRCVQVRFLADSLSDTVSVHYATSSNGETDMLTGDAAYFDLNPFTPVVDFDRLDDTTSTMTAKCFPVATRYGGNYIGGDYLLIIVTPGGTLYNGTIIVDKWD